MQPIPEWKGEHDGTTERRPMQLGSIETKTVQGKSRALNARNQNPRRAGFCRLGRIWPLTVALD